MTRAILALAIAFPAAAQQAPPIKIGSVVVSGSIRSRLENWGWFETNTNDSNYTYLGNHLRLNFTHTGRTFDWTIELAAPILLGLPENSIAPGVPGQLGHGPSYYVSNDRERNAGMVFPKQSFIRFKNLFGDDGASLRLGRFEFQDASEVAAKNATLGVIKRDRVQQRLLGPFGFTHVMRSFDGFHFTVNHSKINYTLIGALPTRGVFQVDGWGWMKTAFAYTSVTGQVQAGRPNTGEWRLFGIFYDDWRQVLKTDSRSAALRTADRGNIRIGTYGGHYVHVGETGVGTIDLTGIAAGQFGSWGVLSHRAGWVNVEAGFQPKAAPALKPWIRAGYSYGSGDGNASDNRHGTFFQLLPTPRPYARFPFFNMMNNEDRFSMLILRPHKRLSLKSEQHSLRLANRNDLWYLGGGAFQPWSFGYQGRAAGGARGLANLYDVSADITVNPYLAFTPYYGYAQGKSAIHAIYPKNKNGHLAFLELNVKF